MKNAKALIEMIGVIRAIAQNGLVFSDNNYDRERYRQLIDIANTMSSSAADMDFAKVKALFLNEKGYITPKVDMRAAIFNDEGQMLFVQQKTDFAWSLPGGWGEIGFSPSESVTHDVKGETGLDVEVVRPLAIIDTKNHDHPPSPFYIYRIFVQCKIVGGEIEEGHDILDCRFFSAKNVPNLSETRLLKPQVKYLFDCYSNPQKPVYMD